MNILDKIISNKKNEIEQDKKQYSLQFIKNKISRESTPNRDFFGSISNSKTVALIAEVKFASPSAGTINHRDNFQDIIRNYEKGGATAISVLTEKRFFQGREDDIAKAKQISNFPVLRKDFIIDEYQVYQSRFLGADAILLIACLLETSKISHYQEIAFTLGMDCLIEIHTENELEKILPLQPKMIGINNRKLEDFSVDLSISKRISSHIPGDSILISESGIKERQDIEELSNYGFDAVLVGSSLMTNPHTQNLLKELAGVLKKDKGISINVN